MNIAVCDDSQSELVHVVAMIHQAFQKHNFYVDLKSYSNTGSLLEANYEQRFDVIFLDLSMSDMNDMEAASRLNRLNESAEIIFVANYEELVYKSYRFKALGCIRKKLLDVEIDEMVGAVIERINRRCTQITFQNGKHEKEYNTSDIIFLQSNDHYVDIITADKTDVLRGSLSDIDKTYAHYGFIRIHSRYLVNYRYIDSVEKTAVVLTNQQRLPISRSRAAAVKEEFQFFSKRLG